MVRVTAGYGEAFDEPGGLDIGGGLLGVHLGYNYQIGSSVLGVEGDYTGSWMEDGPFGVDDIASIRARAGYFLAMRSALRHARLWWADARRSVVRMISTASFWARAWTTSSRRMERTS